MSDNSDHSEIRTKLAEDRTILANERTFSAWMGTGLGSVGIAIALRAVFGAADPTWVAKAVASLFLTVSILIYWSAHKQACKTLQRLSNSNVEVQPVRSFTRLATAMTIATLATGAVLWSL